MKPNKLLKAIAYLILSAAALSCIIPFLIVFSSSLTEESEIIKNGFSISGTIIPIIFDDFLYKALASSFG